MKKSIKGVVLTVILILAGICAAISHFLPAKFDKAIWNTDYEYFLAEKYIDELDTIFTKSCLDETDEGVIYREYDIVDYSYYDVETLSNSVQYDGRKVTMSFLVNYKNNTYIISFEGSRMWFGEYEWKMTTDINILNNSDIVKKQD